MSLFKEDIQEAKERLTAWWDHELIDRPCISYYFPRRGARSTVDELREVFDPWYLAEYWDGIDDAVNKFEQTSRTIFYGGESIPRFFPNFGPGILAAIFGIEPVYKGSTVWFKRETALEEIIPLLESTPLNQNNPWYHRLLKTTEITAKRAQNNFCVAVTDIGGVLDVLSSLLGPEKLIMAMKQHPDLIDTCRTIILQKLMQLYDALQTVIERHTTGCSSWLNLWCPKRWYPLQCDFSYILSPKLFTRFVLPDLITQAESLDYAIYHLDGPMQLKYLDTLLTIPSIHGIQWVPGASAAPKCSDQWLPVYKKIQAAGKNIIIDLIEELPRLPHFYNILDPKGLFIIALSIEPLKLQYYLPTFIGGQGGSGDYRAFRRRMRNP